MQIFVIIVTYNAMQRDWIERCLRSLEASTVPVTPIVIDNGSTDGTRDFVPAHFPNVVWRPQDKNLGFGQANNVGLRYALEQQADYALLLNQDATLAPDAVEQLIRASEDNTLLSPLQLNGDGSALDIIFKAKLLKTRSVLFDHIFTGQPLQQRYVGGDYSAACWFIPMTIVRQLGGFDPIFFHYCEDDNYLQRVRYHGFQVAVAPLARMYHDRSVHGNQQAFNKNAYRREMLCMACDINLSWLQVTRRWALRLYHSYVDDLRHRAYVPGTFFVQCCWFVTHFREVLKSRRVNKKIAPNWL